MKHDFQYLVPHAPISESRKMEIEDILRAGNKLLKEHHEAMKRASGVKRHSRVSFLKMVSDSFRPGEDVAVRGIVVPAADAEKILLVGKVEWELLSSFSNMINKIVLRWTQRDRDVCLSREDLVGEAYAAAKRATTHFINPNVRFCTFLHWCVSRHLSKVCCRTNGLSSLSASAVKLKLKYRELSSREGANFDSVVCEMNLSASEASKLQAVLCRVQSSTVLDKSMSDIAVAAEPNVKDSGLLDRVRKLELSGLERAVLEGFLESSSSGLGLSSISKNLINPDTQKPYSRMAFTFAFRRVKEKVAKICKDA
jgi:hypothetical protein